MAKEHELESIGVQAAVAAHSLGTPLSTITVIAKELERETRNNPKYSKPLVPLPVYEAIENDVRNSLPGYQEGVHFLAKDDFNNLDCYQDVSNASSMKDNYRKRWKEKLGKKEASEECNLKIEKISGKEAYLVTISIKKRNGREIKIVKRLNEHQ